MIKKIVSKYKKNNRFFLDNSKNYFKTYVNSYCLISDLSGTVYTYSFLINRPVIFYSKYEKKLNNLNYYNLNFFRDREKIGVIVDDVNNLLKVLKRKKIFIK